MTEEIKEILDDIRFVAEEPSILEKGTYEDGEEYSEEFDNYLFLEHKQDKILYDYITNLQQENKVNAIQIETLNEILNYENIRNDKLQIENEKLKYNARGQVNDYFKDKYADEVLKNAKLQQDLNKVNDIIEKDRQFYKCRMDEYAELKKENKRLKEIIKDNTILVKDENGNYQGCNINPLDYKSRFEKTIKDIDLLMTGNYEDCGTIYMQSSCCNKRLEIIKKDLIGSDENE